MARIAEINELLRRGGVSVSGMRKSLLRLKDEAGAQLTFTDIANRNGRLTAADVYRVLNILLEICQEKWIDQIYALVSHTVFDLTFSPRLYDKAVQERVYGSQDSQLLRLYDAFVKYRYTNAWGVRIWNTREFAEKLFQSPVSPLTAEERLKVLPAFLHSTHPNVASLSGDIISRRTKILLLSRFDRIRNESSNDDNHLLTWFVDPKRTFMLQTRSRDGNSLNGTLILGYDEVQKQVRDAYWENYAFLASYNMVLDTPTMNLIDSGETSKTVYESNKQVIIEALDCVREEYTHLVSTGELLSEHQGLLERIVDPVQAAIEHDLPFATDYSFLVPSSEGVEDMEIVELETELKRFAEAIGLESTMAFQRVASAQSWRGWRSIRDLSGYFDRAPHKSLRHLLYSPESRPSWHDFPVEWQHGAMALGYEEQSFSRNATTADECRRWIDSLSFEGIAGNQIPLPLLLQTTTIFDGQEGTAFPHYALSRILDKLSRFLHHRGAAGNVVFSDALPPDERNVLWFNIVRLASSLFRFFRRHPDIHRSVIPRFIESDSEEGGSCGAVDGILVFEIFERTYRHGEKPRAYSHLIEDADRADNEATTRLQFRPDAISQSASFREWLQELASVGAAWLVYAGNHGPKVARKTQLYVRGYDDEQELLTPDDTALQALTAKYASRFPANFTICFPYKRETHESAERGLTKWCRLADLESFHVIRRSHEIFAGKRRSNFTASVSQAIPAVPAPAAHTTFRRDESRERPRVVLFCSRLTTESTDTLQSRLRRLGYAVSFVREREVADFRDRFRKADLVLLHRGEENFTLALDAVPAGTAVLVFSGGGMTEEDAERVGTSLRKRGLYGVSCPYPVEPSGTSQSSLLTLNWDAALKRWETAELGSRSEEDVFPVSLLCDGLSGRVRAIELSSKDLVILLSQIHTATGNVRSSLRRLHSYCDADPAKAGQLAVLIDCMDRSVTTLVEVESKLRGFGT